MTDWYLAGYERRGMPTVSSSLIVNSTAYTNFIARTSGLDSTHLAAYQGLLDGLTNDGLFNVDGTSSYFDLLYILATQNTATAILNLTGGTFQLVNTGGNAGFVADQGYLGVDAATNVYLDTSYFPATNGVTFTQNSGHLSAWSLTNSASGVSGGVVIGVTNASSGSYSHIYPKYNDGTADGSLNTNVGADDTFVSNADSTGHYIETRTAASGANSTTLYKNGSSIATGSTTSAAVSNLDLLILAETTSGGPAHGGGYRISAASAGAGLDATKAVQFYNRLRTYMTAVGVP